jgi:hypothetical protein
MKEFISYHDEFLKQNDSKTIKEAMEKNGCHRHHTSYVRTYVSRKTNGYVEKYKGKFGEGYVHVEPNRDSTQYSFITYYVR